MPYTDKQLQALDLNADFTSRSNTIADQSLRVVLDAAHKVQSAAPQVVPQDLPGPSMAEVLSGKIVSSSA